MGNRAVITTEESFAKGSGLGVYVHWNGGRDSVSGFLEYCRLRSFRRPENDDYGWARLCQVIANFMGADGTSVGIDDVSRLDMDNGDNGVYLIRDWRIVGREFFHSKEQNCYDLVDFIHELDRLQPEGQQLGRDMIDCLLYHGKVISDISWNYAYEIGKRAEAGKDVGGFGIGKYYSYNERDPDAYFRVVDKTTMELVTEIGGEVRNLPRFKWRDGSESTIIVIRNGMEVCVDPTKEVIA